MSKIALTHGIRLQMVGKCGDRPYNNPHGDVPLFCKAELLIDCGLTQKDEFSLGQDGISNITITNYKFHDTKESIMAVLDDEAKSVYRYRESWAWRQYCKDQGHLFTDAFMNTIYKKTASVRVWFYCDWFLRNNSQRVLTNIDTLKKPVHSVGVGYVNALAESDKERLLKIHSNR